MKNLLLSMLLISAPVCADEDRFEDVRGIWMVCAGCHGTEGQGMGSFPALVGKNADYIIDALLSYRNGETRGPLSGLMWSQAKALSEGQIGTLGVFVQEGLPSK